MASRNRSATPAATATEVEILNLFSARNVQFPVLGFVRYPKFSLLIEITGARDSGLEISDREQ
jgi:hypothetical protein